MYVVRYITHLCIGPMDYATFVSTQPFPFNLHNKKYLFN